MLLYRRTSLMDSSAQTLVNTVNCVGVMGKGVALEFKKREPKMFVAYKNLCAEKKLFPGKLWLWKNENHWTLNFPTKIHWRNPSRLEWIEAGLEKFCAKYADMGINEISFPRLGCGNGGLDWEVVRPLMESYLSKLPIDVYIHDFTVDIGLPEHLEGVAQTLKVEQTRDPTFDAFFESLGRALLLGQDKLCDVLSHEHLAATLTNDELVIRAKEGEWEFDREALRGVWVALQQGLLTKEKAGWSAADGGQHLLSILSLLPRVRPIQIQRYDSCTPELAVEQVPLGTAVAPAQSPQREFAWR